MERRHLQFGMTALLLTVCGTAGFFALVRSTGLIATGMIAIAVALVVAAIYGRRWSRWLRFALGFAALPILWFGSIDWTMTQEHCTYCLLHRDILRYRIMGWCVDEEVCERQTWIGKVADDLGAPCTHPETWTWYRYRLWGLLICGLPCENGACCLSSDESWYDDRVSRFVHAWAAADPGLASEFSRRVLYSEDLEDSYRGEFFDKLQAVAADDPGD